MGTQRIRIGDDLVDYDDAKRDVKIRRELIDIWKGDPGKAGECMNAQCIRRNKRTFPHPVWAVSVLKSRVFIVDKVDRREGVPLHAIRYVLSAKDGDEIAQHDILGSAIPATLTLRAPKGRDVKGTEHPTNNERLRPRNEKPKGLPVSRGEKARLLAAVGVMKDER
jgi:hypothetical protein